MLRGILSRTPATGSQLKTEEATVIATFSRRMQIKLADGTERAARIKGKTLKPVCGDRVRAAEIEGESDWLITDILKRKNVLSRPNMRGKIEVLAANLELLIVVAAHSPKPDWFIVDRYLSAAEEMGVAAMVVYNKVDLAPVPDELHEYATIGYDTIYCSTVTGENIDAMRDILGKRTAIMVGQSGVGKSSLINCLLGSESQRTATISDKTSEGRHTTVNSEMLTIPGGAKVIDSPGVRDYAPALSDASNVAHGFREIAAASQDCRFANCRHIREPHCAVKARVESGQIGQRRYESYRRLHALTERLAQPRS